MLEKLLFAIVTIVFFVYIFIDFFRQRDKCYVAILIIQAIGIIINFLQILFNIEVDIFFIIIKYVFSLALPLAIIIMEKRGKSFAEFSNILLAKIYIKFKNNKKAKITLIDLENKFPDNYLAHKLLAQVYEQEGGMRKAIDEYVQAIDLDKKDYNSYYKVANLLSNLDKKDESIEMLFNLVNKKPDYYEASVLLGDLLIQKQLYKEAGNVYQNALKFNPESFDLNYNLAIACTMLNDFQSAKKYYDQAAKINSLSYNSKYSLAEIAMMYKNLEEAEQKFLEVVEDDELAPDAYLELSKISLIKSDKDNAIKYANIAIDLNPKKMVEKLQIDPIFIPIIGKVSIPFNLNVMNEEIEKKKHLQEKELQAKDHLEKTNEVTRHFTYNDIKYSKKESSKNKEIEDRFNKKLKDELERHQN